MCYIFEKHFRQKSVITNRHIHLVEDPIEMLPLKKGRNEATFRSHLRNTNGHNKQQFFKYSQLTEKQEDHSSLASEEGINIYINPRCEYNNVSSQERGKYSRYIIVIILVAFLF